MATIWEETKTQSAKMKGRPFSEKLSYFWEYYKIHVVVAAVVLFIVISLIHAWATSKDPALSVVVINSLADSFEGVTDEWVYDLSGLVEFDPKKYEISVDTSVMLGAFSASGNQEYASMQKLAALFSSASVDILIADTESFERYAQNGYIYDLRELYTKEELDKMKDIVYYTDAATFSDYSNDNIDLDNPPDQSGYTVDHHDPDSMKEPVPVGFSADPSSVIGSSDVYAHLSADVTFQGHPSEAVMGIAVNSPRTDAAKAGIAYFTGR